MEEYEDCKKQWEEAHFIDYPEKKIYIPVETDGRKMCNCYHYTTLNNFWNMVNSDVLYARHVRFSNDSEEYRIGQKIIEKILNIEDEEQPDFYMLCFCRKDNLLSQWREYAKGGVCLGFDLEEEEYYTILSNSETVENSVNSGKTLSEARYLVPETAESIEKKYNYAYAKPLKVFYVGKKDKKIKKLYEKARQIYGDNKEAPTDKNMRLLIPYIKHKGFKEEEEARLIFQPLPYAHKFQVNYMDDNGVKKPYIKVEFGIAEEKNSDICTIVFDHAEDFQSDYNNELGDLEKRLGGGIQIRNKEVNRHNRGQVIIGCCSRQKEIFDHIDYIARQWNYIHPDKMVKIWCKGHLPIREITIGPCLNKEEVAESIAHYIRNIYWLKYAEIKCCGIPYRDKR